MNARPHLARHQALTTLVGALSSVVVSLGLLGAVTGMFQREGVPFRRALLAERACADYAFVSEREACVRLQAAGPVAHDLLAGQPVLQRTTGRWEQAFSADGGATWKTNWRMDFERVQ